jgi:hypothetical protein
MADVNPKMPLVQFPFSAGIEEGTRDEVVDGGAGWLVLENGRQDKRGGYTTRLGFTALANGLIDATSPTAGYKLFADRMTAVRVCDNLAQVYDAQSATWKSLGRVPDCALSLVDLPSMGTSAKLEDQEYCNGYMAVTWRAQISGATGYAFASLVNATTWAVVRGPEQVVSSQFLNNPMLASYGTKIFLIVAEAFAGDIFGWYIDTATAASITTGWVSMGTLRTADHVLSSTTAASIVSLTDRIAIAYINISGGASQVTVCTIDTTGVLDAVTLAAPLTPAVVDIAGTQTNGLLVGYTQGSDAYVVGLAAAGLGVTATAANLLTTATPTSFGIAASSTAGAGRIVVTATTAGVCRIDTRSFVTSGGAIVADGAAAIVRNAQASGRPFQQGTRYYVPVFGGASTNDQKLCVLVDCTEVATTLRPVANVAPSLAVASGFRKGKSVAGATSTLRHFGLGITRSGVADASALAVFDFASTKRWQSVQYGNSTYLTGGAVACLDGAKVTEVGFMVRPTLPTTAVAGTGITGTFRYACVYEEVDSDGNWQVSGLSSPSAAATPADDTVTVTTTPLSITARSGASAQATTLRVAFYRTLTGGVAPYYRLGTTINDTAAATVTFADAVTDATLAANAKLYSQPGVVGTAQDKRPPPGLNMLVTYNGMLVGATGSDVWFSGQNVSGEGAWFNPIFQVPIPGEGDITAMWVQDGTLFVSKRREIYALSGEAPSDNGAGGLGLPRRLAVDLGCIDARSTCTTAFGTIFQSDRGIEILTRAQSVEWIGEAIQTTLAAYPIVTSVTVEPVSSTVLVELAASESAGLVTGNGRTAVYDLTLKAWVSTDRRKSVAGVADTPSQSACMVYTGSAWRYAWLGTNGRVYHERSASYLDADDTFVAKRAISGNVKVSGLQGLQHVNRTLVLAKYHTAHDLNLSFAYDYSSSFKTARLYTAAQIATLTSALPNMQIEHPMHDDSRCESVRVQLQDVTPSSGTLGTGQGATWVSLCFEVVPQTGAFLLPDESR